MNILETLAELSALDGPSGFEGPVARRAAELLAPFADEVSIDTMGSVIVVKRCGATGAKRLMLDAHIDEIGLIVTGATSDGFLRFAKLGGVNAKTLPASEIKIITEPPTYGVIDVLPPHILSAEETEKAIQLDDMTIDIGAKDAVDALGRVPIGTAAVAYASPRRMGENCLIGKAFDDRASLVAILRALELLGDTRLDVDLFIVAGTQEEVGTRGAKTAAFAVAPDWAIVVDVDFTESPDSKPGSARKFGEGAVISVGPNMNRPLTDKVISVAKAGEIPYQISVEAGGDSGTNARVIQVTGAGVATALLGIPLKNMHSPVEIVCEADIEAAARLICETVKLVGGGANACDA
ncbi:MAG: M20/M25/M40 family metallo-hydrolase [Oscillospiraceae bacterium]|jgi:endoglucanase|nr:M20/M25/M40 family metallo-hydrolase [Oscillospiraceae bacterium]